MFYLCQVARVGSTSKQGSQTRRARTFKWELSGVQSSERRNCCVGDSLDARQVDVNKFWARLQRLREDEALLPLGLPELNDSLYMKINLCWMLL